MGKFCKLVKIESSKNDIKNTLNNIGEKNEKRKHINYYNFKITD